MPLLIKGHMIIFKCLESSPERAIFIWFEEHLLEMGQVQILQQQLAELAETCAASHAAHVIDLSVGTHRGRSSIQVFIDAVQGVSSDLCSAVSRELGQRLDTLNIMKGSYDLVVSSPGINRPLKYPWQYTKHIGRKMKLLTASGEATMELRGTLEEADDRHIRLVLDKSEERKTLAFTEIIEATVLAPW